MMSLFFACALGFAAGVICYPIISKLVSKASK